MMGGMFQVDAFGQFVTLPCQRCPNVNRWPVGRCVLVYQLGLADPWLVYGCVHCGPQAVLFGRMNFTLRGALQAAVGQVLTIRPRPVVAGRMVLDDVIDMERDLRELLG